MKPKPILACLVIGVLIFLVVGQQCEIRYLEAEAAKAKIEAKKMPTFRQLQQKLKDKGHDIEVDGIIGDKTIKAWDSAICQQSADIWVNKNTMRPK